MAKVETSSKNGDPTRTEGTDRATVEMRVRNIARASVERNPAIGANST